MDLLRDLRSVSQFFHEVRALFRDLRGHFSDIEFPLRRALRREKPRNHCVDVAIRAFDAVLVHDVEQISRLEEDFVVLNPTMHHKPLLVITGVDVEDGFTIERGR